MKSSVYMLEKEWLENTMVTRVPLFILVCGFVLFISLLMNSSLQHNLFFQMEFSGEVSDIHLDFGNDLNAFIIASVGMLSLLLTTLYFPKTIRKERQEGSAMFWRSMPVTDWHTHAVKLVFGLLVIPLISSMLVLFADFLLWMLNLASNQQLALLFKQQSLLFVMTHWLEFLFRMLVVGVALLPLAGVVLAISQKVSSPLLVMIITVYLLKWLPVAAFGSYVVSDFVDRIVSLPTTLLFAPNPIMAFVDMGIIDLLIYFAIGAAGLILSVRFSRTMD